MLIKKVVGSEFEFHYSSKKDVNQDCHIVSSPISQSCFFEEVRCLSLASLHRGYIELLKFDVTIKKIKKFIFV